jgi:hypothetical protein
MFWEMNDLFTSRCFIRWISSTTQNEKHVHCECQCIFLETPSQMQRLYTDEWRMEGCETKSGHGIFYTYDSRNWVKPSTDWELKPGPRIRDHSGNLWTKIWKRWTKWSWPTLRNFTEKSEGTTQGNVKHYFRSVSCVTNSLANSSPDIRNWHLPNIQQQCQSVSKQWIMRCKEIKYK